MIWSAGAVFTSDSTGPVAEGCMGGGHGIVPGPVAQASFRGGVVKAGGAADQALLKGGGQLARGCSRPGSPQEQQQQPAWSSMPGAVHSGGTDSVNLHAWTRPLQSTRWQRQRHLAIPLVCKAGFVSGCPIAEAVEQSGSLAGSTGSSEPGSHAPGGRSLTSPFMQGSGRGLAASGRESRPSTMEGSGVNGAAGGQGVSLAAQESSDLNGAPREHAKWAAMALAGLKGGAIPGNPSMVMSGSLTLSSRLSGESDGYKSDTLQGTGGGAAKPRRRIIKEAKPDEGGMCKGGRESVCSESLKGRSSRRPSYESGICTGDRWCKMRGGTVKLGPFLFMGPSLGAEKTGMLW